MAQKFTSLDEAAQQLGISKDRLNQIREAGKIRAYRDGAGWKFRAEDIEKLAEDGIPAIDPGASDLALDLEDDDALGAGAASGLDLDLTEDEPAAPSPAASDVNLEDVDEPTVGAGDEEEGLSIELDDESIDLSDSILLSETELGTSTDRPPSTIIGKAELDPDGDLFGDKDEASASDVKLAAPGSGILTVGGGDDSLALDMEPPSPSGNFEGLAEVEVDLEAESSRILSPEDLAKARGAAAKSAGGGPISDIELAPSDSDAARAASDIGLGSDLGAGTGLTGLSALELDDDDDDQVLGEGSDVTLSSESSGINIISPSDSGLALDEVALDLSGSSAIGSSLALDDKDNDEVELAPLAIGEDTGDSGVGGAFQLTPLGEDGAEDEKDSSQVIALDEVLEEEGAPLGAGVGDSGMLVEDFGPVGLAGGAMAVGQPTVETPFSTANVVFLGLCLVMLAICGMMTFDLVRNMWSWDSVTPVNSLLLDMLG